MLTALGAKILAFPLSPRSKDAFMTNHANKRLLVKQMSEKQRLQVYGDERGTPLAKHSGFPTSLSINEFKHVVDQEKRYKQGVYSEYNDDTPLQTTDGEFDKAILINPRRVNFLKEMLDDFDGYGVQQFPDNTINMKVLVYFVFYKKINEDEDNDEHIILRCDIYTSRDEFDAVVNYLEQTGKEMYGDIDVDENKHVIIYVDEDYTPKTFGEALRRIN